MPRSLSLTAWVGSRKCEVPTPGWLHYDSGRGTDGNLQAHLLIEALGLEDQSDEFHEAMGRYSQVYDIELEAGRRLIIFEWDSPKKREDRPSIVAMMVNK